MQVICDKVPICEPEMKLYDLAFALKLCGSILLSALAGIVVSGAIFG